MKTEALPHDALLIVDMQKDFLPGGSLGIPGADAIIPAVNFYISCFANRNLPIIASRDHHPAGHISFHDQGGPWPPHCIAGTEGAAFHPDLQLPDSAVIISKATEIGKDVYSAMEDTSLPGLLVRLSAKRIFICGLALDYCVLYSGRDLLRAGYEVIVLSDGVKAVNLNPDDGKTAMEELRNLGATELTRNEMIP